MTLGITVSGGTSGETLGGSVSIGEAGSVQVITIRSGDLDGTDLVGTVPDGGLVGGLVGGLDGDLAGTGHIIREAVIIGTAATSSTEDATILEVLAG